MNISNAVKKSVTKLLREANQLVLNEVSAHAVSPSAKDVTNTFVYLNECLINVSSDSMQLTQVKLFETPQTQL